MTRQQFESYAQNGEDTVLWRALSSAVLPEVGRYIEIGANDPVVDSVSWAFYQRGWRGITAEPVPSLAAAHRSLRPEDVQVEAVVGSLDQPDVVLHEIEHSGLSTIRPDVAGQHAAAGWQVQPRTVPVRRLDDVLDAAGWGDGRDIHFLSVDTEGSEQSVLESLDLARYRPWVLVVEATAPTSTLATHDTWEPLVLAAGYELCLFDGLSRFYVAAERADQLRAALSYPACSLDDATTLPYRTALQERDAARQELAAERELVVQARAELADVTADLVRWRLAALTRWSAAASGAAAYSASSEVVLIRREIEAIRNTVSWRVTAPLRTVRTSAARVPAVRALLGRS